MEPETGQRSASQSPETRASSRGNICPLAHSHSSIRSLSGAIKLAASSAVSSGCNARHTSSKITQAARACEALALRLPGTGLRAPTARRVLKLSSQKSIGTARGHARCQSEACRSTTAHSGCFEPSAAYGIPTMHAATRCSSIMRAIASACVTWRVAVELDADPPSRRNIHSESPTRSTRPQGCGPEWRQVRDASPVYVAPQSTASNRQFASDRKARITTPIKYVHTHVRGAVALTSVYLISTFVPSLQPHSYVQLNTSAQDLASLHAESSVRFPGGRRVRVPGARQGGEDQGCLQDEGINDVIMRLVERVVVD